MGGAEAAAAFAIFGALMAAKAQQEANKEDLDKLAEELAIVFEKIDPTGKAKRWPPSGRGAIGPLSSPGLYRMYVVGTAPDSVVDREMTR